MSETIAFVGLGTMGLPMAESLLQRQMRVVGYDMRPAAMERIVAAGGRAPPRRPMPPRAPACWC